MPGLPLIAGCCCDLDIVYSENDCNKCDLGTTPLQWSVTLSGIELCIGCNDKPGSGKDWEMFLTHDPNGTYVLTQTGNNCGWAYQEDVYEDAFWSWGSTDGSCTGSHGAAMEFVTYHVELVILSGRAVKVTSWYERDNGIEFWIFRMNTIILTNCDDSWSCSDCNLNVDCLSGNGVPSKNGSVSAVPV